MRKGGEVLYKKIGTVLTISIFILGSCKKRDRTAPRVVTTSPSDGATDVVTNTNIRITFSERMDTASGESAFNINPATDGSFSWQDSIMTYAPSNNLNTNTLYTVTITTDAKDLSGNELEEDYSFSFTTGSEISSGNIYMLGRSVLEGWFVHWGWDWDDEHPVVHDRFTLYHRYISAPWNGIDNMIDSIRIIVENIPSDRNPIIFFKLCFADFEGGDQYGAETNLKRNEGIVDSVYKIVSNYGYRLIVGNALPVPSSWIDQYMVWNQTEYNQWLLSLQTQHPGEVFIFDFYGILADDNGAIKDEYTDGEPDDAHPNEAGYNVLDTPFFNFLECHF